MKVYVVIVTTGIYCDFYKFEVFSTKKLAEEYMDEYKRNNPEEDIDCFLYEKEVR